MQLSVLALCSSTAPSCPRPPEPAGPWQPSACRGKRGTCGQCRRPVLCRESASCVKRAPREGRRTPSERRSPRGRCHAERRYQTHVVKPPEGCRIAVLESLMVVVVVAVRAGKVSEALSATTRSWRRRAFGDAAAVTYSAPAQKGRILFKLQGKSYPE